jgi:hypothetical protein
MSCLKSAPLKGLEVLLVVSDTKSVGPKGLGEWKINPLRMFLKSFMKLGTIEFYDVCKGVNV